MQHFAALQKAQGGVADLSVVAHHPSPYLMQEPETGCTDQDMTDEQQYNEYHFRTGQ